MTTEVFVPKPLWPKTPTGSPMKIEVIGGTGPYASGKTLFGLTIAPGKHPEGHPFAGQPRACYLDFEKSGGSYGGSGALRVDVPTELQKKLTDPKTGNIKAVKSVDIYNWFRAYIMGIKPLQYDVIIADPITDVEAGLCDYVRANPGEFGYTAEQFRKGGGIFWGAVKERWKNDLAMLAARCQTFYFTAHLRSEWMGNTPTGKLEPKGKDTLMELASLYLWFEREPIKEGKDKGKVPDRPSAIVVKERLSDTQINAEGELDVIHLLPPRLPVATVAAIRDYIRTGVDFGKLSENEKVIEKQLSDEAKLLMRKQTAEAEREAEESALARLNRTAEIMAAQQRGKADAPQSSDRSADVVKAKQEKVAAAAEVTKQEQAEEQNAAAAASAETPAENAPAEAAPAAVEYASKEQLKELAGLLQTAGMSKEDFKKGLAKIKHPETGEPTTDPRHLSAKDCNDLIERFKKVVAAKKQ